MRLHQDHKGDSGNICGQKTVSAIDATQSFSDNQTVEYYEMLDRMNGLQVHLNPFESEQVSCKCV